LHAGFAVFGVGCGVAVIFFGLRQAFCAMLHVFDTMLCRCIIPPLFPFPLQSLRTYVMTIRYASSLRIQGYFFLKRVFNFKALVAHLDRVV
jgi:hypothetical protein